MDHQYDFIARGNRHFLQISGLSLMLNCYPKKRLQSWIQKRAKESQVLSLSL